MYSLGQLKKTPGEIRAVGKNKSNKMLNAGTLKWILTLQ